FNDDCVVSPVTTEIYRITCDATRVSTNDNRIISAVTIRQLIPLNTTCTYKIIHNNRVIPTVTDIANEVTTHVIVHGAINDDCITTAIDRTAIRRNKRYITIYRTVDCSINCNCVVSSIAIDIIARYSSYLTTHTDNIVSSVSDPQIKNPVLIRV